MKLAGRSVTASEVRRLIEALASVTRARGAVRLVDFPRLTAPLGIVTEPPVFTASDISIAHDISLAIARAVHVSPGTTSCLAQTLAAHTMLRRRHVPTVTRFGAKADGGLSSHAWIQVGEVMVAGERHAAGYTEVLRLVDSGGPDR